MRDSGVHPNAKTYACVLKACDLVRNIEVEEYGHSEVRYQELLRKNTSLDNSLVGMYGNVAC